ncbi:MAG: hypothetical protein K5776_10590 [Lachnospiraceae bacterium]|nr:hypothetical protein [Lachnospiraceae bacterium]
MILNEREANVYACLFSHADNELKRNRQFFGCEENIFLRSLSASPKNTDYTQFADLQGEALLECLFLVLFQRLPSEKDRKKCAGKDAEGIVKYVVNKPSFSVRGMQIDNCPYSTKPGLKGRIFSSLAVGMNSPSLRRFAKKMPRGIQNAIRGIFA